MAYTTINKSSEHFNTKLYTGNSSVRTISGVGFQPDFTWLKVRDGATAHMLFDSVRGALKRLQSNSSNSESTAANTLTAWNSDGFALGTENDTNNNSYSYASWNWKANGAGSANTYGTINSTVSANTTSGFSIVSYVGTSSAATVAHGLSAVPDLIIWKNRSATSNWVLWHKSLGGANKAMTLQEAEAVFTNTAFMNNTLPTSSVFSVGDYSNTNGGSENMIAYCFAEKTGYSKFGSYKGNGSTNGTFIYTGFKPSFFLVKRTTGTEAWIMFDNKRNPVNGVDKNLKPNLSEAETSQTPPSMDFLSNGVKFRNTDGTFNNSGIEFIYMAFAEAPLVGTNNVPCTAR